MRAIDLDTDGSVGRQGLEAHFQMDRLSLMDLRDNLQFYADRKGVRECARRLAFDSGAPKLHLLGSGDFHHLTLLILQRIAEPFVLIVFDNHTDCSFLHPKYHCGNWMYHAALLPGCRKVIHVGATEGHGMLSRRLGLSALVKNNRVSLLSGAGCEGAEPLGRFKALINEFKGSHLPAYVSVDKDVLKKEESPGDWDNGVMNMGLLTGMIGLVTGDFRIAGADVTGEAGGGHRYRKKPVKNLLSHIEHPAGTDRDRFDEADSRQKTINIELMKMLGVENVAC